MDSSSDANAAEFLDDLNAAYNLHPPQPVRLVRGVEALAERLFSVDHLYLLVREEKLLGQFASFIRAHRPDLLKTLQDFIETQKILAALGYANALSNGILPGMSAAMPNTVFEERAKGLTESLVHEALPAYITHKLFQVVTDILSKEIHGSQTAAPVVQKLISGGGVKSFCITDPAREDNPVVFASEEFFKTTHYGLDYVIGRNCRFLHGPGTSQHARARLASAVQNLTEAQDLILNYHRGGSPFFNLLMTAPLLDHKGCVMYFIGAQIDVTKLIEDGKVLDSFSCLLANDLKHKSMDDISSPNGKPTPLEQKTILLEELTRLWSKQESRTINKFCRAKRSQSSDSNEQHPDEPKTPTSSPIRMAASSLLLSHQERQPRLRIPAGDDAKPALRDVNESLSTPTSPGLHLQDLAQKGGKGGATPGVFANYLLVRPYPDLTITFAAPALRSSGLLHSSFTSHLGGTAEQLSDIKIALKEGIGVSSLVIWLASPKTDNSCNVLFSKPDAGRPETPHPDSVIQSETGPKDGDAFPSPRTAALMRLEGSPKKEKNQNLGHVGDIAAQKPVDATHSCAQFDSAYGRWITIHCTPLFGSNGNVGVWMVLLLRMRSSSLDMNLSAACPGALIETVGGRPLSTEHNSLYFWGSGVAKLPLKLARSHAVVRPDPFGGHGVLYTHAAPRPMFEHSFSRRCLPLSPQRIFEDEERNESSSAPMGITTLIQKVSHESPTMASPDAPLENPPLPPMPNARSLSLASPGDLHLLPPIPPSPPLKQATASSELSKLQVFGKSPHLIRQSPPVEVSTASSESVVVVGPSRILSPTKVEQKEGFPRRGFGGNLKRSLRHALTPRSSKDQVQSPITAPPAPTLPWNRATSSSQPTNPGSQRVKSRPSTPKTVTPHKSTQISTASPRLTQSLQTARRTGKQRPAPTPILDKKAKAQANEQFPTGGRLINAFPAEHPSHGKQCAALYMRDCYQHERIQEFHEFLYPKMPDVSKKQALGSEYVEHGLKLSQLEEEEQRSVYDQEHSHHYQHRPESQNPVPLIRPKPSFAAMRREIPFQEFFSDAIDRSSPTAAGGEDPLAAAERRTMREHQKLSSNMSEKVPPKGLKWLRNLSLRKKKLSVERGTVLSMT